MAIRSPDGAKKNNGKTKITSLLSILFLFVNSFFFITIKWHCSINALTHQKQMKSKDSTAGIEVPPFWNSSLQMKLKWNIQRQRHKKSHFPVETVSEKPISEKSRLSRLSPSPPSLLSTCCFHLIFTCPHFHFHKLVPIAAPPLVSFLFSLNFHQFKWSPLSLS